MYLNGCDYWENRFDNWKTCVDAGFLEFECDSCVHFNHCFIQDEKEKKDNKKLDN